MSIKAFPKALESKAFSTQDAYALGLTKYNLKKLLVSGKISKISRGYYQHEEVASLDEESLFENAFLRTGKPSTISLVSALVHYGLTDLIGKQIWIMVPATTRRQYPDIRLVRVRTPEWEIGITKGQRYWITNIERTLIDCLIYKRLVGTSTAIEGIKRALEEKKSNLNRIYHMSKKLKVDLRVLPYIEALT
jgi:predicted transcriptional regulator of viral defense system